jgi:hypothetical protein
MTLYGPWLGGAVVQQLRQGANGRGLSAPSDISSRDFIGPIHASSRLSLCVTMRDRSDYVLGGEHSSARSRVELTRGAHARGEPNSHQRRK